ncbi:hypothetical protein AX17_001471 [Amanita inopinata Kibby_2008]|nr:hypothetical protein AX17_001471 [Amanita inopinata Kibby_2008]
MDDASSIMTRLLTLLNVSATKVGKRKRSYEDDYPPPEKLNKRKSIHFAESETIETGITNGPAASKIIVDNEGGAGGNTHTEPAENEEADGEVEDVTGLYEQQFGSKPSALSETSRSAVDKKSWISTREQYGKLGLVAVAVPECGDVINLKHTSSNDIPDKLKIPFISRQNNQSSEHTEYQNDLLSCLSTRRDLYISSLALDFRRYAREAVTLHALNHIMKKRRRVLKNNERLVHAAKTCPDSPPEDVQDQGFTRPSILILLPFRSAALDWFSALTSHTPSPAFQIENQSRFLMEYGLPLGAVDKLASAEPGTYPPDHVETFKGNVDDNFRVGVKLTRKSVKMFSDFYDSDIIIASPLGLRRSIEKEKNADYLSSIEILVVDQMDALSMQNWDHVKFVLSSMNQLPKESHNTDFSRVKPWYLDGHSIYLRQSILISAFETPDMRSVYNSTLKNIAGKIRTEKRWSPIEVPEGINQNFIHFDCSNPKDEADKRFHYFTTQVLPAVLKSAVQSVNTAIFIPSSFDFIRVHNYLRKHAGVSFVVLSEYSSNQDISRARQAFFLGKKPFLLISERFHFYKRYKIRGIHNLIFYGPPDHPQFFTELLTYPFLDEGVEASDVTCRVLYSKYDWFKLERIVGTDSAVELIKAA